MPSKKRVERKERARLKSVKFSRKGSWDGSSTAERKRKSFSFSQVGDWSRAGRGARGERVEDGRRPPAQQAGDR
jgi:hypothetical protein